MTKLAPFPGSAAVARAKTYVGRAAFSGMCQAFTVTMFGTGGVGDFDGDRDADAVDGWRKAVERGKVVPASQITDFTKIPAGVGLYWKGGSRGYGHASVSIGGGQMVTTDRSGGRIGQAPIKGWWASTHTFLGYVLVEGNGYTLLPEAPAPAPFLTAKWGQPTSWKIGSVGADVTRLGERLVVHAQALGLPAPYKTGPGPTFTETDRKAVEAFQRAQGWTGKDADGYPGPTTFKLLEGAPQTTKPKTLTRVMSWNLKSPTLPVRGWPSWVLRRGRQVAEIARQQPSVLLLQEAGSPSYVAWYDTALAKLGYLNARAYDAEGSGKWRVIYYRAADWTLVASGLADLPASTLYKGDQKPHAWAILRNRHTGEPWAFDSFHLENDAPADNERRDQALAMLTFLDRKADEYDVPAGNRVAGGDTNSRSWVRDRVHALTRYRDVFTRAKRTAGGDKASHNDWKDARAGERIDVILSTAEDVTAATQSFMSAASDHNPQTVQIAS